MNGVRNGTPIIDLSFGVMPAIDERKKVFPFSRPEITKVVVTILQREQLWENGIFCQWRSSYVALFFCVTSCDSKPVLSSVPFPRVPSFTIPKRKRPSSRTSPFSTFQTGKDISSATTKALFPRSSFPKKRPAMMASPPRSSAGTKSPFAGRARADGTRPAENSTRGNPSGNVTTGYLHQDWCLKLSRGVALNITIYFLINVLKKDMRIMYKTNWLLPTRLKIKNRNNSNKSSKEGFVFISELADLLVANDAHCHLARNIIEFLLWTIYVLHECY